MIDLTPLEVRKKKGDFRRAMRGYDGQSVDDFLDLVADRLEQLVRENASLRERVTGTEALIADYRDRERALTEALVTAQEMREEMRQQMEREVELKRREAEADAEAIRTAAAQIREREEENIRRLRARQGQFVQSYRSFLERELAELSVIAETLDFAKLQDPETTPAPASRKRKRAEPVAAAESFAEPLVPAPVPPPVVPPFAPAPAPAPVRAPALPPAPTPMPAPLSLSAVPFEPEPFEPFAPEPVEPVEPDEYALADFDADGDDALIDLTKHFPPTPAPEPAPAPPPRAAEPAPVPVPAPAPARDVELELELTDEVAPDADDDEGEDDNDGWVSSLLEGKGD